MITSFLNAGVEATPGNDCITLDISRLPPGFFSISSIPMILAETGVSIFLINGEALITTSPRLISSSSNGISILTWLLLVTITAPEI